MKYSEAKAAEITGLKRITIQRFRNTSGLNDRKVLNPMYEQKEGLKYYFYDEIEMEKLWLIKIFQSLGKSSKEIVDIMTDEEKTKIEHLSIAVDELEKLIGIAKQYIKTGIGHKIIKEVVFADQDTSFENLDNVFKLLSQNLIEDEQILGDKFQKNEKIANLFDYIINSFYNMTPYDHDDVQMCIRDILFEIYPSKYYSLFSIWGILMSILGEKEVHNNDMGLSSYMYDAFEHFLKNPIGVLKENCVDNVFENIIKLQRSGYSSDSSRVFQELYKFAIFLNSLYQNREYVLYKLNVIGNHLSSSDLLVNVDSNDKEVYNLIYDSIKCFSKKVIVDNLDFNQ